MHISAYESSKQCRSSLTIQCGEEQGSGIVVYESVVLNESFKRTNPSFSLRCNSYFSLLEFPLLKRTYFVHNNKNLFIIRIYNYNEVTLPKLLKAIFIFQKHDKKLCPAADKKLYICLVVTYGERLYI